MTDTDKTATEVVEEQETTAYEHAPEGMRSIGDWFLHVAKDHEGDVAKCPPPFADLDRAGRDLMAWADRMESGPGWVARLRTGVEVFASNLDLFLLIPSAVVFMVLDAASVTEGTFVHAAVLLAAGAWSRLMQIHTEALVMRQRQAERRSEVIAAAPVSLEQLMGMTGPMPTESGENVHAPGQYL